MELLKNPDCDGATSFSRIKPADSNKSLTFILIYYNDVTFLAQQINQWVNYTQEVRQKIEFLFVDDGSHVGHRASDFLNAQPNLQTIRRAISLSIVQIHQDLAWNIGGARNLGFGVAPTDWVYLSDCDIMISQQTMEFIIKLQESASPSHMFRNFQRLRTNGKDLAAHPALMLLQRAAYWNSGGCDEDFIGNYGYTDVQFFHRAERTGKFDIQFAEKRMREEGIPPVREVDDDKMTCPKWLTCIEPFKGTKLLKDPKPNQALYRKKSRTRNWSNSFLRFSWHEVREKE